MCVDECRITRCFWLNKTKEKKRRRVDLNKNKANVERRKTFHSIYRLILEAIQSKP